MIAEEFESRLVEWACRQADLNAVVLAGSRARKGKVDDLADWDIQLISSEPARYIETDWIAEIGTTWCVHAQLTPRKIQKICAVFEGGFEVDFIPLANWQMRLVYFAMRHPRWVKIMPMRLRHGVFETRAFMLGSGYRILVGDNSWHRRLEALQKNWPRPRISEKEFVRCEAKFWQGSVWIGKKIIRGEVRSAMHWLHRQVLEDVYSLLAEEALIADRAARPEARKAEQWLDERRLLQTALVTAPDQAVLARALLAEIALFEEVSASVARSRGFPLPDHTPVAAWLRAQLEPLAAMPSAREKGS